MPTKEAVLALIGSGKSYEEAAEALGVSTGQAYLVATGLPADGSDSLAPEDRERPGILGGSPQALVNPPQSPHPPDTALDFLKRRAAGDLAMRDAARRRDAVPPEPVLPEDEMERLDVIEVLGRDHNQVNFLLEQVEAIPSYSTSGSADDASKRQSIIDMIIVALAGHEAAEEAHLWPAVSAGLPDGQALAQEAAAEEQEAKETLRALEQHEPASKEYDELVEQLSAGLRKHVAFEEKVFLRLRSSMDVKERARIGKQVLRAEQAAPTHPHAKPGSSPSAPWTAPFAGVADRLRDGVGGRPASRKGKSVADDPEDSG